MGGIGTQTSDAVAQATGNIGSSRSSGNVVSNPASVAGRLTATGAVSNRAANTAFASGTAVNNTSAGSSLAWAHSLLFSLLAMLVALLCHWI